MGVEELTLAGESRVKELDSAGATALFEKALTLDAGYSRAHLQLGIHDFNSGRYASAVDRLMKAIERNPYADEAYYYLAMSQLALGKTAEAERNLYYIWPHSAYFSDREYHLGRLALIGRDAPAAISHLRRAIQSNGDHLSARALLAMALRERGDKPAALAQLSAIDRIDPANPVAHAERFLLTPDVTSKARLLRLLGGQTQEAITLSIFYRNANRWADAVRVLELVALNNSDPWGTTPEFYYTLAHCQRRAGQTQQALANMAKARAAAGKVDRFAYREESEAPLAEAVAIDPTDSVARFNLAALLYFRGRPAEAIAQWEAAVAAKPADFSSRRALGLAYAEQGQAIEKAAAQLEQAIELNPAHVRTLNDLSNLYARSGKIDEQLAVLTKALARSPGDDVLVEGILGANLMKGDFSEAARIVDTHKFAPRHRTYGLRDKYRMLRYGQGTTAFKQGDFARALTLYASAGTPPISLGMDDFESQVSPRLQYYLGRTYEAMGKSAEAKAAYLKAITGMEFLTGDRDSWNSENLFMIASLDRLGRAEEASRLEKRFEDFARGEIDSRNTDRRAEARYLLGLVMTRRGLSDEGRKLMQQSLEAKPDMIPARLELRGDTLSVAPRAPR
jgi:tetratricopeptide (TPR) repeat protein